MSGYLTWLADVLRDAGLVVVEQDGWQYRARGSGGFADGRPWCVMWHHTASNTTIANDASYCSFGSPDAPITNLLVESDGVVWVCAAGATNTNGTGDGLTTSHGRVPADSMNTYAVGMEICNNGVGEPYPTAQIDACFAASNAINAHAGNLPTDIGTHENYAPARKIDPATTTAAAVGGLVVGSVTSAGSWSLDDLRAECARRADNEGDDMPLTDADVDKIAKAVWKYEIETQNDGTRRAEFLVDRAQSIVRAYLGVAVENANKISPTLLQKIYDKVK